MEMGDKWNYYHDRIQNEHVTKNILPKLEIGYKMQMKTYKVATQVVCESSKHTIRNYTCVFVLLCNCLSVKLLLFLCGWGCLNSYTFAPIGAS